MKSTMLELMIKLNKKGWTIKQISEEIGRSLQYTAQTIKKDPRYVPGKRGFARLTKDQVHNFASLGGINAHKLGVAHTWNSKEARAASLKRIKIRKSKK